MSYRRWNRRETLVGGALAAAGVGLLNRPMFAQAQAVSSPKVVVIGSGIAGLSAAYDLKSFGFNVEVFEAGAYVGGRMAERQIGPILGPVHASSVFASNNQMANLAGLVGLDKWFAGPEVWAEEDNGYGVFRRSLRFNANEAAIVPGITDGVRKMLPTIQQAIVSDFSDIDPCLPWQGADLDTLSVQEYFAQFLSKDDLVALISSYVDPIVTSWSKARPSEASAPPILASFAKDNGGRFFVPTGGIGRLVEALASSLSVRLNTPILNVSAADSSGRRSILFLDPEGKVQRTQADVVVCALPGNRVLPIMDDLDQAARAVFEAADFSQSAFVAYVLDDAFAPAAPVGRRHAPGVKDPLKRRATSWSVRPPMTGQYARPTTASIELSDEEIPKWQASGLSLPEYCVEIMRQFYPSFDMDQVTDTIVRGGDYVPFMKVGFCKRAADLMRAQAKGRQNLYFAGECVSSSHTGGACASGRHIAKLVKRHWA